MVDLADLADNVVSFEQEGRHGLAQLARYQNARQSGTGDATSEALAYFDKLAAAFLDVAQKKSGDIRAVALNPELGLVHPGVGKPRKVPIGPHTSVQRHEAYWMALYRAELVESGVPPVKANKRAGAEFNKGERAVRKANKAYRWHVRQEMKIRTLIRRLI